MSVDGGRPEVASRLPNRRDDPKTKVAHWAVSWNFGMPCFQLTNSPRRIETKPERRRLSISYPIPKYFLAENTTRRRTARIAFLTQRDP